MTKKTDKPDLSNDPRVQLFVYGLDEAGKPKGARFLMSEMETVAPVITAQKLQFFDNGSSEETVKLGMKLAVGRIYARGKSFIPNIKRDLYDGILAALASDKAELDRSQAERAAATAAAREATKSTEQAPAYVPTVLPPLASGLPQNWESIAAGNMVLADEGPGEGWWEAIVIARDNDILTLRYRDYPKAPKFERHISTIGLINRLPSVMAALLSLAD
jgi:hypothetical protein